VDLTYFLFYAKVLKLKFHLTLSKRGRPILLIIIVASKSLTITNFICLSFKYEPSSLKIYLKSSSEFTVKILRDKETK